jgi:hypothetical protein
MASPPVAAAGAARRVGCVLYKLNDLRVLDHEPLLRAHSENDALVPLLVLDPHWWGRTPRGFPKTGYHRSRFLAEAAFDLRQVRYWLMLREAVPQFFIHRRRVVVAHRAQSALLDPRSWSSRARC